MVLTQSQNLHLIQRLSPQPPMTSSSDNDQCYSRGSYGSHTTSWYLYLSFWCPSFLAGWTGCPKATHIFFVLCSMSWGHPFLDFDVRGS
jgi:hypothetical protein